MVATKKGIYHNLKESKYVVSNNEITYFFSSELYRDKFLETYKENREKMDKRSSGLWLKQHVNVGLDFTALHDLIYYRFIEKRGFRVMMKGVNLTWQESVQYALRRMIEPNMQDYRKIHAPKLSEHIRNMV